MKNKDYWYVKMLESICCTSLVAVVLYKLQIPNPNVVLIAIIVFFTFSDGFSSGIPCGIITILYSFFFFLKKGPTLENEEKLIVICIFIPVIIILVGILKMKNDTKSRELLIANRKLSFLANQDALTHIPNRRFFDTIFHDECVHAFRTKEPISFVMIDIDFFKQYNDTYGHISGDECLRSVARAISRTVQRDGDYVARYGGEEFSVILLPATDKTGARIICKRIQKAVRDLEIRHETSNISKFVTVSFGISGRTCESPKDYYSLIASADTALYRAKMNGRNRIEVE